MRRLLLLFACALALLASPARAAVYVSAGITLGQPVERVTFRERLAPYGRWIMSARYGEVWVPSGLYAGWRPYSDGRWVLTEYGWTFVSDDPWGWAAWHYGNWVLSDDAGWVWIPGRTWAPAWVGWRYGGGYAAWYPLAPAWAHVTYTYYSPAWVVVPQAHFTQPIARVAIRGGAVAGAVQVTQPLAGPVAAGGVMVNPGPRPQFVASAVGHPVQPLAAGAIVGHGTAAIAHAPRAPSAPPAVAQRLEQHWSHQPAAAPRSDQMRPRANAAPRANAQPRVDAQPRANAHPRVDAQPRANAQPPRARNPGPRANGRWRAQPQRRAAPAHPRANKRAERRER